VQPVAEHVGAADRPESGVGADHDQRRQQRRERRGAEPAVGLQDPVEDDREPVQQYLRGEDDQHPGADAGHHRARAAGGVRQQQGHDRVRGERQHRADRHQQQHRPGQQRRRDPAGGLEGGPVIAPLGREAARPGRLRGPRQHRHHHRRERAAEHDVVDDVRHHVGGRVRGAQARRAHRVREHHLPPEPDQPGQDGDHPDHHGSASNALPPPPSRPSLGHFRNHGSCRARVLSKNPKSQLMERTLSSPGPTRRCRPPRRPPPGSRITWAAPS
jgi:hypothetical protein